MFTACKMQKNRGKRLLTAVSAMILMASAPAFAEGERTSNQKDVPHYSEQEVKQGMESAKDAVSDVGKEISEVTVETYNDIKATINGDKTADISTIGIDQRMTAAGMIGQPVYNARGERVAKVKDIILSQDGEATMVVLADGDWTGLGKLAAFDYSVMTQTNIEGEIIAPLTEEMIDNAASFSYDRNNNDDSVKVIPRNGFSAAELLDSQLVSPNGDTLAEIDNISFQNAKAERLVLSFGQTLGMGGAQAAIGFSDPEIILHEGKPRFQLSAAQTEQFKTYKKTALSN